MPRAGRRIISKKEAKDLFRPEELKPVVKTQKEIVFDTICSHKEGVSSTDIQEETGIAPRQIRNATQILRTDNLITKLPPCSCGSEIPRYIKS